MRAIWGAVLLYVLAALYLIGIQWVFELEASLSWKSVTGMWLIFLITLFLLSRTGATNGKPV